MSFSKKMIKKITNMRCGGMFSALGGDIAQEETKIVQIYFAMK
jgi:hypothetical protein